MKDKLSLVLGSIASLSPGIASAEGIELQNPPELHEPAATSEAIHVVPGENPTYVLQLKDMPKLGLRPEVVQKAFNDSAELGLNELVKVEIHRETRAVRITTTDGLVRDVRDYKAMSAPRNLSVSEH